MKEQMGSSAFWRRDEAELRGSFQSTGTPTEQTLQLVSSIMVATQSCCWRWEVRCSRTA